MENELNKLMKEKGIFFISENPINKNSSLILKHSQTKKADIEKFINKNKEIPYDVLDHILMNVDKNPVALVNPTDPYYPCYINLGYSFFESLILKANFLFFSDVFISHFDIFVLYHELGHTSFFQRFSDTKFKKDFDFEAHSDMFALFVLGKKLNKACFLEFLDGYFLMRNKKSFSDPNIYCTHYSKYIYHFFKENYDSIDFNIPYKYMDARSYYYIVEFKDYKKLKINDNNAFKLINELISNNYRPEEQWFFTSYP